MKQCTVCGSAMAPGDRLCTHCGRADYGSTCNTCHQPAPTLIRGGAVVCAGCGAVRGPLAGVPLDMVGSAHRVGSWITGALGWAMIAGGLLVGGLVGLIVSLFAASLVTPLVTGVVIGALGAAAGAATLSASKSLDKRAKEKRDDAMEQGILAMAQLRKGSVTTVEVAQNLAITLAEADRLLSSMSQKGRASVEINREGILQYTFRDIQGALDPGARVRIDPASSPQETARIEVDREWERMAERRKNGLQ
ncbi:MAG: zinc ribbon domain-containing protein [Myxococcales bacterium]|nr:zinc ribbon domain-containing protein [Myxococcales bacterium]